MKDQKIQGVVVTKTKQPKCGDLNMYKDWDSDNVILEVYGIGGELVEKLMFSSYDSARFYILKNF